MQICCSLCGKDEQEVTMLFKSWSEEQGTETPTYICDLCVVQCYQQLVNEGITGGISGKRTALQKSYRDSVVETLTRAVIDMQYKDYLIEAFAERAGMELTQLDDLTPTPEALKRLPETMVREHALLPLRMEKKMLVVAFYDPLQFIEAYDDLVAKAGCTIKGILAKKQPILNAIEKWYSRKTP
jgi:hypothetical protein